MRTITADTTNSQGRKVKAHIYGDCTPDRLALEQATLNHRADQLYGPPAPRIERYEAP